MEASVPQLLLSGLKLMLVGMAIVYLFLALLVGVIGIAARLLDRSAGDSGPALASPDHRPGAGGGGTRRGHCRRHSPPSRPLTGPFPNP